MIITALAVLAGAIALVTRMPTGTDHAMAKHGSEPVIVQACLDKNGAMQIWHNPITNRHIELCRISPDDVKGNFGARVSANKLKDDVTLFIFRKMHTIDQVVKYLLNRGYVCTVGC